MKVNHGKLIFAVVIYYMWGYIPKVLPTCSDCMVGGKLDHLRCER